MKKIKTYIESNIDFFKQTVLDLNSYTDLCKFFDLPNNGKQYKYFNDLIKKYDISTKHWVRGKNRIKRPIIEKECPVCKIKFKTKSNIKKEQVTCSHKCSSIFFGRKHTLESREKISKSVKKYMLSIGKVSNLFKIKCGICGNEIITHRKNQRFCSLKCSTKFRTTDPICLKNLKDGVKRSIQNGTHHCWGIHKIGQQPSYPELFFINILKHYNIVYEYDKPVGKYYVDFAIKEKMIALEIDGGQHKEISLKYRDDKKDKFLIENGWVVYRIPWKSINNDSGKEYIKKEILKFINFYNKIKFANSN